MNALAILRELEAALAEATAKDPEHWNAFHTSRLAAARGRATRLIGAIDHVEYPTPEKPADHYRA